MEKLYRKNSLAVKNSAAVLGIIPANPGVLRDIRRLVALLKNHDEFSVKSLKYGSGTVSSLNFVKIRFKFEESEYTACIAALPTAYCKHNACLYLPFSTFAENISVPFGTRELRVTLTYNADYSRSYYAHIRLAHALIPDSTAVFDHSRMYVFSPEWVRYNARSFFPNPYTMVHVFFCEAYEMPDGNDCYGGNPRRRYSVITKGLKQIGMREIDACITALDSPPDCFGGSRGKNGTAGVSAAEGETDADRAAFMLLDFAVQFILFRERFPREYEPLPLGYYYVTDDDENPETVYAAWRMGRETAELLLYPCGTDMNNYRTKRPMTIGEAFTRWGTPEKPLDFSRIGFISDEYTSYLHSTRADDTFDEVMPKVKMLMGERGVSVGFRLKMAFYEFDDEIFETNGSDGGFGGYDGGVFGETCFYDDDNKDGFSECHAFDFAAFNDGLREDFREEYEGETSADGVADGIGDYDDRSGEFEDFDSCEEDGYDEDDEEGGSPEAFEEIWFDVSFDEDGKVMVTPDKDCLYIDGIRRGEEMEFEYFCNRPVIDWEIKIVGTENGRTAEEVFGVDDAYLFV